MNCKHLIYIRYAFPLEDEPGPKRHLDIVRFFHDKGYKVSVISAGTNFLSGKLTSNFGRRLFIEQDISENISIFRTYGIKDYRSTVLRRIISYLEFLFIAFLIGMYKIRIKRNDVILVDVIPPFSTVTAYLLATFKKAHLALEITDLPETMFEIKFINNRHLIRLIKKYFLHLYDRCISIVTLTPRAKRHIEKQGIISDKLHLIPNWCSDRNFLPPANRIQQFREEQGWRGKFVVLYTGGFGRAYDLMTMIKAAEYLKDKNKICFVLMGEGEKKKDYMNWCAQNNINNCLLLPGCPREKLSYFLSAADVCVNLFHNGSFWSRAVGHKIFDYFEHAKPIIFAGEEGDTSDIIKKSEGGIVVKPGNVKDFAEAILKLYRNPSKAKEMGSKGREFIKKNYNKNLILNRLESAIFG